MKEHLWCRSDNKSSLFDVSHMGQIRWHGKDRVKFLERVVVGDIDGLNVGGGCLSLVTNVEGGILDDTVITKYGDYVYMVRACIIRCCLVDCSLPLVSLHIKCVSLLCSLHSPLVAHTIHYYTIMIRLSTGQPSLET